jgi:autotransporter-associated beta strand protein
LDLNDMIDTTGSIAGRGQIDLGSGTLRAGQDDGTAAFSGLIVGPGTLFKFGTGMWTLTANNTYSGLTTVSAGTLVVNGSQPQSPVVVNGTATLMGDGVVGNLQVFGSLRPGASPGVLTSSNVAFSATGDYFVELNGHTPGTGYDQLNVRGTNQLGGSTLHVSIGGGFAPFEGEEFVILNNDGSEAIVNTFAGLANGATSHGQQSGIPHSLLDAFGNDVVLTLTNAATRFVSATVSGGNGDGNIDVNECNFIDVVITNRTGAPLPASPAPAVPRTPASRHLRQRRLSGDGGCARGTNTTPFQFSVGPGFLCGTNIDFELVVQTPANGTFAIPFSLPSGSAGPAVRFNNNSVTAIPDNGSVDVPIMVAGLTTPIQRVTVSLHSTPTTDSDLDMSLIGPDGTTVNLSSNKRHGLGLRNGLPG